MLRGFAESICSDTALDLISAEDRNERLKEQIKELQGQAMRQQILLNALTDQVGGQINFTRGSIVLIPEDRVVDENWIVLGNMTNESGETRRAICHQDFFERKVIEQMDPDQTAQK